MADEADRQRDRTQEVPETGGEVPSGRVRQEAWQQISDDSDAARRSATPGGGANTTTVGDARGGNNNTTTNPELLAVTNAFNTAQDRFNSFLEGLRGGKDNKPATLSPDSCKACTLPRDQIGGGGSDSYTSQFKHKDQASKPETTLEQLPNGQLRRVSTTKNADGSSLAVTTKEEYVRDEQGKIKKDKDGHAMTRVLEEDKVAKDKDGKTVFSSHKENHYNKKGDLDSSHEELFRIGKDGKLNKLNSFDVKNEYDEKGQLTGHHAYVKDVNGVAVQSTDAKYTYDKDGNRATEVIDRVNGDKQASHEERKHEWQKFGDKFEIVKTESKFGNGGRLTTTYDRDEKKGTLTGEHTTEKDGQGRVRHQFDAKYDEYGYRTESKDVHTTFHKNGKEESVTTSEFKAFGDSTATRVEKDEEGKITSERGITQRDSGEIVDSKTGKTLLSPDQGASLGGWWDKETAWNSLERLAGDATNRDVISGWDNLGKMGGEGKQAAAIERLEKWGQGDVTVGIDVLEQKFGNGDGRAAQGLDTYLKLGSGAAMKETLDHTTAALTKTYNGLQTLLSGVKSADGKTAWEQFQEASKAFGDAVKASTSTSEKAEKAREMIHKDAGTSGDLLAVHGNGCSRTGVCKLEEDGDKGKPEKPGEPDAVMRGIQENLKWSPTGDFGEATQLRLDVAGGDMMRLREMTAQMGTTETLGPNGEVVQSVSRMQGNDAMLKLGTQPIDLNAPPTEVKDAEGNVVRDAQGNPIMRDAAGNVQVRDAAGNIIQPDASGNVVVRDSSGKVIAEVPAHVEPTRTINPEQAVDQFKRAGIMPDGHYEPMQAARNFFEGGVTTAMTTDSQGRPTPVLDAEGHPVYLRSGDQGVEAVMKVGGGNPVVGMDVMTTMSRTSEKDPVTGEVREVTDMRVGFTQLPKIGETLVATENGTVVPVRDSMTSAQTILNYGEPARDAQGNPIPVRDEKGNIIPPGVVGAQALMELTRTSTGTDGARIYDSIQAATGNERAMFERAVAEGKVEPGTSKATFSAAEMTRENLQFIGRTEGQQSGSALEGARVITREQTTPDGRSFTISPDGSVVGGLNAIRAADSAPADRKTVMGGAQEIALFQARQEGQPVGRVERDELGFPKPLQMAASGGGADGRTGEAGSGTGTGTGTGRVPTFIEGARNTAMLADRTDPATGRPVESTQLFTNGISNVQSFAKDGTFSGGRETISVIGGGSDRVDSITRGIQEVRTASDATTHGSVSQMAAVTTAAGGGDPRVGAESMMTYRGRDGQPAAGSYSEGAKQLYTDLYGSPNAPHNISQTLQPRDVERAVSIAAPGTAVNERLQSGMDKTNEIVRHSGNPELTGSSVLTNLANNEKAMEVVRTAPNPVAAREALAAMPGNVYQQIITPVPRTEVTGTTTGNAAVVAGDVAAVKAAEQKKKKEEEELAAASRSVVVSPVVQPVAETRRDTLVGDAAISGGTLSRTGHTTSDVTSSTTLTGTTNNGARNDQVVAMAAAVTTQREREAVVAKEKEKEIAAIHAQEVAAAAKVEVAKADAKDTKPVPAEVKAMVDAATNVVRQLFSGGSNNNVEARVAQTLGGERGVFSSSLAKLSAGDQAAHSLQTIISAYKTAGMEAVRAASTSLTTGNAITARAISITGAGDAAAIRNNAIAAAHNVYVTMANAVSANAALAKAAAAAANSSHTQHTAGRGADISALRTGGSVAIGVDGRPMTLRASISSIGNTNASAGTSARSMDMMIGRSFQPVGNGFDGKLSASDVKTLKGRARKFRKLGEDDLALLGAELALVALLVSASIAKEKAQKAEAKGEGSQELAKASDGLVDVSEVDNKDLAKASYQPLTRPTWLVRGDEDLVKLAEHLFHEAELGWLIADLNMGQTKESYVDGKRIVELKARQKIDLPVWQDIVEFHRTMPRHARPENLVTIVNENAVDTELMNATLGLAMGATEAAQPALPAAAPLPIPAPAPAVKPTLVLASGSKEGGRVLSLASAKNAALLLRRKAAAATTALVAKDEDQDPTAPAVATNEELKPKYV